jgi:hypothetical protein
MACKLDQREGKRTREKEKEREREREIGSHAIEAFQLRET